jgi:hypothetical protein
VINPLLKKSFNKKKVNSFLIILSFLFGFLQVMNFASNNQISSNLELFNEEKVKNVNIAAIVGSDWEIARGSGQIALINKPNNTREGDLLLLLCTIDGTSDPMTGPIGWSVLLPENNSVDPTTASWYKIADASEPTTYNVTWGTNERYVAGVIRITGHDKANPIQATATSNSIVAGIGDVINPPVNVTKNNTLIVGFHGLDREGPGDDYGSTFLETGPTVLYAKIAEGGAQGCSAGVYYEIQTNQGMSPSRTWSIGGGDEWYAATVAINLNLPIIDIISPIENDMFGVVAPNYTVEIIDPNLTTMWYTMDGGLNNYTFTDNGTIDQSAWDALPDGVVNIKFYADNSLGSINFQQVNIFKDGSVPNIHIVSPIVSESFGINPPSFIVEITDANLDTMWYSIFNISHESLNITFVNNGTIDSSEWAALSDGTYTLRFYANDTLGNINYEEVNIIKDIYTIIINILSPLENEVFGANAPNFVVEIICAFLNSSWYTLNGAIDKYFFAVNETINQTAWGALSDGVVPIRFYANNSIGEIEFEQVNVIKDTLAPIINIINPLANETFGVAPPDFTVEIIDMNIDTMWYLIYNSSYQSLNFSFTDNGTIDPTEWSTLSNGIYTIRFDANDTAGNTGFKEVNITKDIYAIFIVISNPIENEIFGANAPNFIVEITTAVLNITWYTLDGGINNFTFTNNETFNEAAWDLLSDGIVTILFYANNSLGDIESEQVNIIKDATAPIINIISPSDNEIFGDSAPSFSVEFIDPHLDTMWYTVNNSATKFNFTQDGVIDQSMWDAQIDGDILLTFYANDTVGNLASDAIIIKKRTPDPGAPPIDITLIIILVSVIGSVAAIGGALIVLNKKGKISLDKLSFKKLTSGRTKAEKIPKEKKEKVPKEKKEKVPKEKKEKVPKEKKEKVPKEKKEKVPKEKKEKVPKEKKEKVPKEKKEKVPKEKKEKVPKEKKEKVPKEKKEKVPKEETEAEKTPVEKNE